MEKNKKLISNGKNNSAIYQVFLLPLFSTFETVIM
jgi:hypothetical protein